MSSSGQTSIYNVQYPQYMNSVNTSTCDASCQQFNAESSYLLSEFNKAKSNLQSAPGQYETAEKNYYTFEYGESGYEDILRNKYTSETNKTKEDYIKNFQKKAKELSFNIQQLGNIQEYDSLNLEGNSYVQYFINEKEGFQTGENPESPQELIARDFTNQSSINSRISYYELSAYTKLFSYYFYLRIIYYILVFLLLILLIKPTKLSYGKKIIIFLLFVFYPLISEYVVRYIEKMVKKIYYRLPSNLFYNID